MSKRTESLARTRIDLDNAAPRLQDAIRLLMDCRPGIPGAQSFDGPNITGGGDGSSPTERCALNPNPTAPVIAQLDKVLRRMEADALWLLRFTEANSPHAPTSKDQATVAAANQPATQLCEHCTPWVRHEHEPVHRTSDVAGNLPVPMALGRWCYDFVRRTGALPSQVQVRRHDEGQRVLVKAT